MKVRKLVLCILLSLAMVVTFIPVISFAQDEEADNQAPGKNMQSEEAVETAEPSDIAGDPEEPEIEAKTGVEIHSISISIAPPVCGTVVTGNSYSSGVDEETGKVYTRQSPQPEVTLPAGVGYELDEYSDENYGLWYDYNKYFTEYDDVVFQGTIQGGTTYLAGVYVRPTGDNWFADDCKITVDGGTIVSEESNVSVYFARITIRIDAVHNWTNVDTSGFLKDGQQYDCCSACGAIQNVVLAPGWAKYYVKKLKVSKGSKSFTVKWKKQSKKNLKKFNGYQIMYSANADMSGAKMVKVGKKASAKTIKKLKKKTKYYVQVRTFTKKGGVTYYSKWSAKKTVKTK